MMVRIIQGDAAKLPLSASSVDLIVTSPPFWSLRSYVDNGSAMAGQVGAEPTPAAYVDSLVACTREWLRVLKPTGSLWINLGDKYAGQGGGIQGATSARKGRKNAAEQHRGGRAAGAPSKSLIGLPWRYALRCIDDLGLTLRAEVIWSKPNGLPESVTDRVRRSHETWFHFVTQPRYFTAIDEIRESAQDRGPALSWQGRKDRGDPVRYGEQRIGTDGAGLGANPLGKLPGSVWTIASQPLKVPANLGVDHFAAFPMEWPRRIILGWSPMSATVLDPFGGTGTTALVASALGRVGISVDMSADYCRLARWRTTDPQQIARAARPAKAAV